MNPRDETLLAEVRRLVGAAQQREIVALKRKIRLLEASRDLYKSKVSDYRKQLIQLRS